MEEKLKLIADLVQDALKEAKAQTKGTEAENGDLLTLGEAATLAKVSKTQLMRWAEAGKIQVFRISPRKLYVSRAELEAAIRNNVWQNH